MCGKTAEGRKATIDSGVQGQNYDEYNSRLAPALNTRKRFFTKNFHIVALKQYIHFIPSDYDSFAFSPTLTVLKS